MGYNFSLLKQVFFYLTLCVASYAAAHNLCGPNDQPSLSLSANYLFINDTALMPGDSQDIPLLIYLEESSRGLQFDVTIPSEFSFVLADLETDPILANFSVTSSDRGNGTYRIIVFTFGSSTLPIGAYPIFYMPVTVDNAALPGFYAFPLTNVTISGTNNQNIATTALVQGFIEILGNNAPVASGQSVSTDEDTMIQITLEATDVDGDPLTYTIVTQPANGTAVLTGNTVDYTPDGNYNGPDSFTFTANDGTTDSNVATVSIDVIPVNDAPTSIEITSSSIVENVIAAVGLISCVDPDADDVYTYELVSGSGDTNNNLFQIIGDELYNIDPLNFETQELYSVRIKASNVNDEIEQAFSIQVTNVNDINIVSVLQDSYCEGATGDGQITITEVNEVSGNVLFDWTGPNGFTSQNQSISNLEPGLYNLELTDDFFTYIESFSVGLIPVYENLEICYVSGDSNEPTKNRIYLNKEGNYNVAAYRVFRETTIADEYEQIGLVLPTDDSFLDNDSNNLIRQYKYKVATVDNCGIESITSPVHFNSFLQANLSSGGSVNLFWEPYVGLSYDSFYIYRSLNGLPFLLLDVLPSNQTVYNDITADVNTNDYTYYIGIFTEPCEVPAPVAGGGSNRMLSIIVESNPIIIINGTLDVAEIMDFSKVVVYPNPTTSGLSIMCDDLTGYSLTELYTINGQLLQSTKSKSISLANYQNGVYLLKIFTSSGVTFKRIIKE